jgi:mannose-6-phosphate isomerase class I
VLKKVITTPTICSAASNFLMIFGDLVTVVFMLSGKDNFEAYINWLATLLIGQIASMKTLLRVDKLDKFDPADFKKLESIEIPSIVESDPDKLDLLFRRYTMSAEDLVWVTVAKIHAYLDLLLITETISRSSGRDEMHKTVINFFLKPEIGRN